MKYSPALKIFAAAVAGCIGLTSPTTPAVAGLLSATRGVIAIVDGELFVGEAVGHLDGSGTIAVRSQKNPALTCVGEFTSSAELGGKGSMRCTDGATANFRFQRSSTFTGHGAGTTSRGDMSFAYGLSATEAAPYLSLPGGKKFSSGGTELTLIDL